MLELGPKQKAWIAALRSGEYKQVRHRLKSFDGAYCCLGVACDVLGLEFRQHHPHANYHLDDGSMSYIPHGEWPKLGLRSSTGSGTPYNLSLAYLNDEKYLSFEEIANVLETEAETYFVRSA